MAELDPITRQEMFLSAAAGESVELPTPITRKEMYLAKAAGEDVNTPEPVTREEIFLEAVAERGSGGDITVESLSVTENGEHTAPSGKAYSPVTVNVPNSYAAGDEGKVVSNGALVAQTAHAQVTQNGTVDTTLNNSVEVAVPAATLVTKSITQNGTYNASGDSADGYSSVTVNVSGGGGASNVVTGTFTGTTTGAAMDVDLNYSGNGYPVAVVIYPSEGAYNSGGTFYDLVQQYAIAAYTVIKNDSTAPTYESSGENNRASSLREHKSSASVATSYSINAYFGGSGKIVYVNANASANNGEHVKFKSNKIMSVYIAPSGSNYGFAANIPYKYWVLYSA